MACEEHMLLITCNHKTVSVEWTGVSLSGYMYGYVYNDNANKNDHYIRYITLWSSFRCSCINFNMSVLKKNTPKD